MVLFFLCGFKKKRAGCFGSGGKGLAVIQRLSRHLSGMVYTHEVGGFALLRVCKLGF
jgi:hypothetical protein